MGTVEPRGTTMKQALLGFVLLALASAQEEEVDPIEALSEAIPGSPGEDYPIYATSGNQLWLRWLHRGLLRRPRGRVPGVPHLRQLRRRQPRQVQLPLPQRHPVQPAVLHLR